jgi:hypothetical protein
VTLRLADEIDVSRGTVLCSPTAPSRLAANLEATLIGFSERPLEPTRSYLLKHGTRTVSAHLDPVLFRLDLASLEPKLADRLEMNDIGKVVLHSHQPLAFDPYGENRATGAFILIDPLTNSTVAAGTLHRPQAAAALPLCIRTQVSREARALRLGHAAAVLEIGVRSLPEAHALEGALFEQGILATVVHEPGAAQACAAAGAVAILVGELVPSQRTACEGDGILVIDLREERDRVDRVLARVREPAPSK